MEGTGDFRADSAGGAKNGRIRNTFAGFSLDRQILRRYDRRKRGLPYARFRRGGGEPVLSVLERAGCFVAVILMGYLLRRVHFFEKEDFKVISKIVIRITLTASIVVNFSGQTLDYSTLILIPVAFCFGILMMATGYLLGRGKGREEAVRAAEFLGLQYRQLCDSFCPELPESRQRNGGQPF